VSEHRQIQEEIPAYIAGRLDADAARHVEQHLESCSDCSEIVRDWQTIVTGLKEGGEQLFEPHPDSLSLMRFVRGEEPDPERTIARHVETCTTCQLETEVWRDQEATVTPFRPRATRSVVYRVASFAVAAGLVLGLGLGLLLRDDGSSDWTGAVNLLTLDGSARGGDDIPVFSPEPAQPYVPLVLLPTLPADAAEGDRFRFSITDETGGGLWSREMTAAEIRGFIDTSGIVTFLVPSDKLPAGIYNLAFARADAGAEILFETHFRVE
jgi:hypothetical protein